MPYESYWSQKRIKEQNRNKILRILSEKPRTFTELLQITKFSPAGLTKILEGLVKDKIITKGKKRGEPYNTKNGFAKQFLNLDNTISEIVYDNGKYYVDYEDHISSSLPPYSPPWGIMSHLYLHKNIGKKLNPFSKLDVFDIEKYIFDKIRDNIKHYRVEVDKTKEGKIVLAYEIDYKTLFKSIDENSEEQIKFYTEERTKEIKMRNK